MGGIPKFGKYLLEYVFSCFTQPHKKIITQAFLIMHSNAYNLTAYVNNLVTQAAECCQMAP